MNFKLKIWRQRDAKSRGKVIDYEVRDISPETSFLEMLDILNENLIAVKASAAPARSRSTAKLMAQIIRALCASFTCESFATARP